MNRLKFSCSVDLVTLAQLRGREMPDNNSENIIPIKKTKALMMVEGSFLTFVRMDILSSLCLPFVPL